MKNDDTKQDVDGRIPDDGTSGPDGLVERLLHAAGPGPEIPADGAQQVKDAIRPLWREGVTARSRQRSRLWAGSLAAAAALIIAIVYLGVLQPGAPQPQQPTIVAAVIDGTLEVTPPGSNAMFLTADDATSEIPRASLIRTRSGSRASLALTNQRSLRIDTDTELRLDSEASLSLDSGAVYIESRNGAESGVEVRTALGTATDIGTQFEVRIRDQSLEVKVREGLVSLARNGQDFRITQGVTLSMNEDGSVQTGSITPFDPAWLWTQEIAPVFEIEGQTVMAFLDWVSSETGFSLRFSDSEVENLAANTILHGSIEGLSPALAPAAILPSARLTASKEPGVLLIRRLDSEK